MIHRRQVLEAAGLALAGGAVLMPQSARAGPSMSLPAAWRDSERLPLWPNGVPDGTSYVPSSDLAFAPAFVHNVQAPELRIFEPIASNGRALLVIPGGGYTIVSVLNEGVDVARRMTALGYTVFVMVYRLPGEGWKRRADVPLQDAQRAMRLIRERAAAYRLNPAKIAALGFSAGGHLAATLATDFAEPAYSSYDEADRFSARPAAVGLIYPVIEMVGPDAHRGSASHLLGDHPTPAAIESRSPARHVGPDTPATFLVHAMDDKTVPFVNSLAMLGALHAAKRPAEAHFFEAGGHGFGLGLAGSRSAEWSGLYSRWLDEILA